MTIATATKKPHTPRKPKAKKPLVPWERPAETPKPPACSQCGRILGWRDAAYVGKKATMCKTCHQKAERMRLHGVYVPANRMPHAPMAYGTERTAKLTARPAWKAGKPKATAAPPVEKSPRWVRSAKRAERAIRRKAKKERAA